MKGNKSPAAADADEWTVEAIRTSEESVIGSILFHGLSFNDASDILDEDGSDFFDQVLGKVWAAMCSYSKRHEGRGPAGIDLITTIAEMKDQGTFAALKFKGDEIYLIDLANRVSRVDNIREHAMLVRKESQYRKAMQVATRLQDQISIPLGKDQEKSKDSLIQETLSSLNHALVFGSAGMGRTTGEILRSTINYLEACYNVREKFVQRQIPTGNQRLDDMLRGGYHVPCYTIVAARPSIGKTAVLCNQIMAGAANGIPHLVCSLEMRAEPILLRMICVQSGGQVTGSALNDPGSLDFAQWSAITKASGEIAAMPITIEDFARKSRTPEAIIACIERWRSKHLRLECQVCLSHRQASDPTCDVCGIKRPRDGWAFERACVWIDHFGLIQRKIRPGSNAEAASAELSMMLATLSKRLNLSINLLCQLNRKVEDRKDKRPILADLRETGSLEQDGDVIVMLYRDEYYNPDSEDKGIIEFIIAKQRDGQVGTVRAGWQKEKGPRIVNLRD